MMSADDMDYTTIAIVGFTGLAASVGVLISEITSSLKAQERRIELPESNQIVERATKFEELVEEVSERAVLLCEASSESLTHNRYSSGPVLLGFCWR